MSRFKGKKYLLAIIAICILLFTAEVLLRVNLDQVRPVSTKARWTAARATKEVVNIVALGDSFTFGDCGSAKATYPGVLAKIFLHEKKYPIEVLNQGVCEFASRQILEPLDSTLLFSHADIALLLVGSADLFDPYTFADELSSSQEGFGTLELVKVLKSFMVKMRVIAYETKIKNAYPKTNAAQMILGGNLITEISSELLKLSQPELEQRFLRLQRLTGLEQNENNKKILDIALTAYLLRKFDVFFHYIHPFLDEVNTAAEFQLFCEKDSPKMALSDFFNDAESYFNENKLQVLTRENSLKHIHIVKLGLHHCNPRAVWKLMRGVSRKTTELNLAVDAFNYAVEHYPYLEFDQRTITARLALQNQKRWRENVPLWFERNMRNIIAQTKRLGVLPVLQTYPIPYPPINEIVRKLSVELSIPLVDHEKIFEPLIKENRSRYILSEIHCTDEGHLVMAKNIYNALTEKILADPKEFKRVLSHGAYKK